MEEEVAIKALSKDDFNPDAGDKITEANKASVKKLTAVSAQSGGYTLGSVLPIGTDAYLCKYVRWQNRISKKSGKPQTLWFVGLEVNGTEIEILQAANLAGLAVPSEMVTVRTQLGLIGNESFIQMGTTTNKATKEPTITFDMLKSQYKDNPAKLSIVNTGELRNTPISDVLLALK